MKSLCRRCKKNVDARTRMGGECHECVRSRKPVFPVFRALSRPVAW